MTETHDAPLVALLDRHRKEALRLIELRARDKLANRAEVNIRFDQLADEIASAMMSHSEFSTERRCFYMSHTILIKTSLQSRNLLTQAAQTDSNSAVNWYRRVLRATSTNVDVVSAVYGLAVREPVTFSNGVRLMPVGKLLPTRQAHALASEAFLPIGLGQTRHPAAAVMTFRSVNPTVDHQAGHKEFLAAIQTIRRTITAFTLSEANTPVTGVSWTDVHDPDLRASAIGYMSQGATYDGREPWFPTDIDPAALEWIERVLALTGNVASVCDLALTRLNLARRRQTPGDQAIDGCISLEALLGDSQRGDLTYKLRLRAARLLGTNFAERRVVSKQVDAFYSLRSKVVHGQSLGAGEKDKEVAERGLDLALTILRRIVLDAKMPNHQELELGLDS